MSKTMLINATRPEEVRVAIVNRKGRLTAYEIELADAGLTKGNIYKASVANVEPSLNAAFIEYGAPKQGFLPVSDVCKAAWHSEPKSSGRPKINEVLKRRRKILVQVVKDAIGQKGAALTTHIALAGRFMVLMPFDEVRGISRKIKEGAERRKLKELARKLNAPESCGFIIRTSALGHTQEELNRDLEHLLERWADIQGRYEDKRTRANSCLYQDNDLIIRMLRDQFSPDIEQVIVDTNESYQAALEYFSTHMPEYQDRLKRWEQEVSLFSNYQLEHQIQHLYTRNVDLPSGGGLVIDPTEALTVVDVNSGRSTKGANQAETALATNLEAARELARQLRLRDIGGLVVVDFIDMASRKHDAKVEKAMADALKSDKARTYVGRISENGLLEINRQRLKQQIRLQTHHTCPTCGGNGVIPSPDFTALRILRRIEERAARGTLKEAVVDLHPEVADYVQNRFRRDLTRLEILFDMTVKVVGRPGLHRRELNLFWKERSRQELQAEAEQYPDPPATEEPPRKSRKRKRRTEEEDEDLSRSQKRRHRRRLQRERERTPEPVEEQNGPDAPRDEPEHSPVPEVVEPVENDVVLPSTDPMELLQTVTELPDTEPVARWDLWGENGQPEDSEDETGLDDADGMSEQPIGLVEREHSVEPGEESGDVPRRRRRRKRRRRKSQADEPAQVVEAPTDPLEDEPAQADVSSPDEESAGGDGELSQVPEVEAPAPRKRRRRRRRRVAAEEVAPDSDGSDSGESAVAETEPATTDGGEEPPKQAEVSEQTEVSEEDGTEAEAESDAVSESEDSGTEGAQAEGQEADAPRSEASEAAEEPAEPPPPRRRRRRRRAVADSDQETAE